MEDKIDQIKKIITDTEVDLHKFVDNSNKSAGLRVRKSMQQVKVLAQDIRKIILDKKNGNSKG